MNDDSNRMNGHRPVGLLHLLHPSLKSADLPALDDLSFDVDDVVARVVQVKAETLPDALTAQMLGNEREGSGIVIDDDGLILTIGYVILEAADVTVTTDAGIVSPADVVGYDYESGFGLVRATIPLAVSPLEIGDPASLKENDPTLIVSFGGHDNAMTALIVSRRDFAGYWEYMLDDAFFTSPPHPNWSGAAMVSMDGKLMGLGSLFVNDALPGASGLPGNMFIPINLLEPILAAMLSRGLGALPARPWLGLFTAETLGHLVVTGVMPAGPADDAGIEPGDIILRVAEQRVKTLRELYKAIWGLGDAGVLVPMTLVRDGAAEEVAVHSVERGDFFRSPSTH